LQRPVHQANALGFETLIFTSVQFVDQLGGWFKNAGD